MKRGVLVFRIEGNDVAAGFARSFRTAMADPEVPRGVVFLIDVTNMVGRPPRSDLTLVHDCLVEHRGSFHPTHGILVKSMLQYGVARIATVMARAPGMTIEIFRDEREAIARLGSLDAASVASG